MRNCPSRPDGTDLEGEPVQVQTYGYPLLVAPARFDYVLRYAAGLLQLAENHLAVAAHVPVAHLVAEIPAKVDLGRDIGDVDVRAFPAEALLGKGPGLTGEYSPSPERFHECHPVAERVIGHDVEVRANECPEIITEGHVDWRQIVECPYAHGQHVLRCLFRLPGKPRYEIWVDVPFREFAGAPCSKTVEVSRALTIDGEESIEHCRDEDRTALVRLCDLVYFLRLGRLADCASQCLGTPDRLAELLGQLRQQVTMQQVSPGARHLETQHLRQGKVLEQRDDVGKSLMERENIRIARLGERAVHAVKQRMGSLVGDHIMGQAGEDDPARQMFGGISRRGLEIAEQEGLLLGAVVGVGLAQRMGVHAQLPHKLIVLGRPQGPPAQSALEIADGSHRDRVNHLLVELGVAVGWRQAILGKQVGVVEVDRFVIRSGCGVEIDHLHVLTAGAGSQRGIAFFSLGIPEQLFSPPSSQGISMRVTRMAWVSRLWARLGSME